MAERELKRKKKRNVGRIQAGLSHAQLAALEDAEQTDTLYQGFDLKTLEANLRNPTPRAVLQMQRAFGNRAVRRMFGRDESGISAPTEAPQTQPAPSTTLHQSMATYRLSAKIRRVKQQPGASEYERRHPVSERYSPSYHGAGIASADSLEGEEKMEIEEEEGGEAKITITDAITPTLTYNATITAGAITPGGSEFGLTEWTANVSGLSVAAASSAYTVTATINCPIKWGVHDLGKTNIGSASDPALTNTNYPTAASDLTPDMSSDGGRPPRTTFWARDLTEKHEKFHAEEFKTYGQAAFDLANTWLGTQTASSEAQARTKVNAIPGRMRTNIVATYLPGAETRAYGDGAPSYRARAQAITRIGGSGGYH